MSTEERTVAENGLTPAEQAVADGLAPFRARLDQIDAQLVELLGERFQICREVAVHKAENEIAMMQPGRVEIVRARYLQHGAEVDLPADFTAGFFDLMIDATCRAEDELMARLAAGEEGASAFHRPRDGQTQTHRHGSGSSSLPPGPRMPRALQALGWTNRALPWLERCRERYGDAFTLRIRHWGDWVLLADPDDVKRVFTAGDKVGVALANPLLGPLLGPTSMMLSEEPDHMRRRRVVLPAFHGEAIANDAATITAVARREVAAWPAGEPFALWPRMQVLTLEVVMRVVFGERADEPRLDPLRRHLTELTGWLNQPRNIAALSFLGPEWVRHSPAYHRAMRPVEDEALAEVRRRRAEPIPERPDVVSMLIAARREDGSPLGEEELRDELVTLLSDGPTSTSLAWAFERLLRNPETLARARAEIADDQDDAYLDAVVKETLRLRPPVPVVVRSLLEPMRIAGRDLPAGTVVAPCIHLLHRDPRHYPDPLRFRPERFLETPPGTYTWIPFGGGTRRCIAAPYAQLEMKRVLREVLAAVDLQPVDTRGERVSKAAISFSPGEKGLVMVG